MSVLKLKIYSVRPDSYLTQNFQTAGGNRAIAERIKQYLERVATGTEGAESSSQAPAINVQVQGSEVLASGTATFSNACTANDTILINGVTFTAKASGAAANEFNVGANAYASASNFAAAVNASVSSLVSGYVTAAAVSGAPNSVTTITSAFYGLSGNQATIAEGVDSGSVISISGARLTGGTADAGALTLNF